MKKLSKPTSLKQPKRKPQPGIIPKLTFDDGVIYLRRPEKIPPKV